MKPLVALMAAAGAVVLLASTGLSRGVVDLRVTQSTAASLSPAYCNAAHDVGRIALTVGNAGVIGTGFAPGGFSDCFTGEFLPSCRYPLESTSRYLWAAALWVGAIVGEDTLVSIGGDDLFVTGREFHPDLRPDGSLIYRSVIDPAGPAYDGAVSEQDYVAVYYDTCTTCNGLQNDPVDDRPHRPLHVKITQRSFAWSYRETEDFVLFDYSLENIGADNLGSLYFGLYVDADIHKVDGTSNAGHADDHSGFLRSAPNPLLPVSCIGTADINAAWTADNDGDFGGLGPVAAVPGVVAICPLSMPAESAEVSFNWWHGGFDPNLDFGPQGRSSFRIFSTGGLGSPLGDRDKYHVLSNGEVDYDQIRLAMIGGIDSIWLPPPVEVWPLAEGMDTRFVISVGPFDMAPGEIRHVPLALTVGDNFHTIPFGSSYLPYNPDQYLEHVDFGDLVRNAVIAGYVYDNPGVDTDGNGYAGDFELCDGDTIWYQGDGVPDWRAATAPPAPTLWIEPRRGALLLRWNGLASETAVHWLSREPVFEGYTVYLALDSSASAFSRIATYDVEDYRRYVWTPSVSDWVLTDSRITVRDAICRYAPLGCDDQDWHPVDFTRQVPYVMPDLPDSVFYFEPVGPNASRFGVETPFVKRYPDAPRPFYTAPEQVPPDSIDIYLTDDGYFKFYEYQYIVDELLAGETYWISVTAFDCGSLLTQAAPLESPILTCAQPALPLHSDSSCCRGLVGNVDCDQDEEADIADVMAIVSFLFIDGRSPCCLAESDINQSGGVDPTLEDITLGDIAYLIDHLFISEQPLPECL